MSIGVVERGSLTPDKADLRRSRSSGGRFKGCISAGYCGRGALRPAFLRLRNCSLSFADLVGDLEDDLLVGDELIGLLFSLEILLSDFFLDGLENKPGRTI